MLKLKSDSPKVTPPPTSLLGVSAVGAWSKLTTGPFAVATVAPRTAAGEEKRPSLATVGWRGSGGVHSG